MSSSHDATSSSHGKVSLLWQQPVHPMHRIDDEDALDRRYGHVAHTTLPERPQRVAITSISTA